MTLDPSAKRERAKRLATDYSAHQRIKDNQDRARGYQRRGAISEASENMSQGSLNREVERVDRPPLSETTEVETELHSANKDRGQPQSTRVKSDMVKNIVNNLSTRSGG